VGIDKLPAPHVWNNVIIFLLKNTNIANILKNSKNFYIKNNNLIKLISGMVVFN